MSTPTPEPLRFEAFHSDSCRIGVYQGKNDVALITVTGPSRERIATQILAMHKAVEALRRIASYPVHSEPVGGAMEMQDIAVETLKQIEA